MADYGKKKVDIYNVLDENGNVEYTLRFPEGSTMYDQANRDREEGRETYVYKPGSASTEKYAMAADANVDVSIDPVAGTITLDGPSWLTSTIANSDSYKKNYSQNKTLLSAVNLYRSDPNAKFADDKNGNPITATEAISQFANMANAYANSYTAIEAEKESAKKRLGVNWTDEDVFIANTSYDKNDYKKDSLVYIPKDAMKEFDFTKLDSWNAEDRTISAEDFFTNVYKETLSTEHEGGYLRNWAINHLEDLLQYNAYDRDDESMADRTAEIESAEYASEVARSKHFYNLLSQNKAEMSAAADFLFGAAAASIEFAKYLQEGGLSLSAWAMDVQKDINNFVFSWNVPLRDASNEVAQVNNMINPLYLSTWMLGEIFSSPYLLESTENFKEYIDTISDDMSKFVTGEASEVFDARRQEIDYMFTTFQKSQEGLTDAWARGEFAGMIAYKIFENVVLLEVAGGMVGDTVSALGNSGSFIGRSIAKLTSSAKTVKFVNGLFKLAGEGANVVVQGILETMIDDRDVLRKSYESGQLSDEALDAIKKNVMWNAIGAGAGWYTGKGVAAAVPWLIKNTASAKVVAMVGWKITHGAATVYDSMLHKFFKSINKGDWIASTAKNASDPVAKYTATTYAALEDSSKTLSKLKVFQKNDPELVRRLEAAWDAIDPNRNLLKNLAGGGDVTAKSLEKVSTEATDRITENYIAMSKTVLTKANLQNQIDMISKGASIKMSEINNYGKEAFDENNRTLREVLEKQAKTAGLTYADNGGGYILSKEASNWMSSTSQYNRFNNRVNAAGEGGVNWKSAGFTSKKEYNTWVTYRDALASRITELDQKLGPELVQLLDNHLVASANYIEMIDNYMITRGFYDIDYAKTLRAWRNRGDWNGPDGQNRFIHTARMFKNEDETLKFLDGFDNPAAYARNSMSEGAKAYVPGDAESDFLDPTLVTQMYLRSAAQVAQAQELGRAIYAAGVPVQKIENFGEDGLTKAEASVITKDVKRLQQNFKEAMSASGIRKTLTDAIKTNATVQEGVKLSAKNLKAGDEEFTVRANKAADSMIDEVISKMKGNEDFNNVVKRMVDAGAKEADAQQYVVLYHMSKLKAKDFTLSVDEAKNLADVGKRATQKVDAVNKKTGEFLKENIDSKFRILQGDMSKNALDAMDLDRYFGDIQREIDEIEKLGIYVDKDGLYKLNEYGRDHIIQLVDKEGNLRFYKADPIYASMVNEQPSYYFKETNAVKDFFYGANGFINGIFRYGTTGVDRISYFNQWAKDSIDANIIGAGHFFTNLRPSTPGQVAGAAIQDVGGITGSLGRRVFGDTVTETFTKGFVSETFESSEAALKGLYGDDYVAAIKTASTKGLSGEAATEAYQRAVVEKYLSTTGYESLPSIGAMTQAKFTRQSFEKPKAEEVTSKDLRAEYYRTIYKEDSSSLKKFSNATKKMKERFNDFMEDTSRGSWRETFWRKNVYSSAYKNAIAAGNTAAESKIYATRYALDATTDFARAFAFGNRFIRSVPYLGASINGMKSFMRLLELDPLGVAARFTFGVTIPYTALLTESLTDPKNLEAYKSIPEYQKENNLVFAYNGALIKIPFPEQLADVLSPFRHMVEKSVGANDHSWVELIVSDVLQLSPVDLSGFAELDENAILSDAEGGYGIGARIGRGLEKAASSLMGPVAKTAYMTTTGRDPFTGYEIDKSYIYYDEEGNELVMDNCQSKIALWVNKTWNNIPASAAEACLKSILGRSTLSVLDGAAEIIFDGVVNQNMTVGQIAEKIFSAPTEAFESAYTIKKTSKPASDWKSFQNAAYEKKKELINDESFQKAYKAVQTAEPGTEKYKNALAAYNAKLDEYNRFVLDGVKSYKAHYPDSYTTNRAAQVISMLSLETGLTLRESESSRDLRNEQYWDAKNAAIDTYVRMGFPTDYAGNTVLGTGYYDKEGKFDFKFFTPYEIEALGNDVMSTQKQIQAMVTQALSDAGIDKNEMWSGYYAAQTKAAKKAYKDEWNTKVVMTLYPIAEKYGVQTLVNNSDTVDLLDNYIFVDNPYKTKQYIKAIFGGDE